MFEAGFYDHAFSGGKRCGEIFQHGNGSVCCGELTKSRSYVNIEAVNTLKMCDICNLAEKKRF